MIGRRLAAAVLAAATIVAASAGEASTRYDPRLRFRTLSTPRFDIHFHQGEEADARRLAILAEEVATTLDGSLGPATGRVQVVLVNQDDLPNGWAIPVPYNLIEIRTVTPGGSLSIGHTDDWLRLVFTHEYTHVVHLSRGGGWVGGLRRVFGRHPLLFPNLALPAWQIEGLAVYEESTLTGAGRLPAGDFRAVLTTASGAGRFEPLDRVSGGLDDWPRGQGPYVYGGYFQQFLAERYGAPALRRLTDRTASLPPYLGSLAYRSVFGQSLGALWKDFAASQVAPATVAAATRLTSHGFAAEAPRFGPDGAVYYSVVDPHGFPALRRLDLPGGASTRIADRYLGDGLAFAGRTIVFDQAEVHAEVGLQFDLFAHALDSGRTTRLTSGARAAGPDLFPDGRIVCTVQRVDRRDLVIYPFDPLTRALGSPRIVATAEGQAFSAPRVSPDGRLIAVERRSDRSSSGGGV